MRHFVEIIEKPTEQYPTSVNKSRPKFRCLSRCGLIRKKQPILSERTVPCLLCVAVLLLVISAAPGGPPRVYRKPPQRSASARSVLGSGCRGRRRHAAPPRARAGCARGGRGGTRGCRSHIRRHRTRTCRWRSTRPPSPAALALPRIENLQGTGPSVQELSPHFAMTPRQSLPSFCALRMRCCSTVFEVDQKIDMLR